MFLGFKSEWMLQIPETVVEIEYGAFLEKGALTAHTVCMSSNTEDKPGVDSKCFEASTSKDSFAAGSCHSLNEVGCKLCYMHQYGLHSATIEKEKYCKSSPSSYPPEKLKECFWTPLPTFDEDQFRDNKIVKQILKQTEKVPLCNDNEAKTTIATTTATTTRPNPPASTRRTTAVTSNTDASANAFEETSEETMIVTMEPVWQPSNYVNLNRSMMQYNMLHEKKHNSALLNHVSGSACLICFNYLMKQ